jgi:glycosyltransferase involved in cell wall biosynthesis
MATERGLSRVSAVIPTFNRRRELAAAIASVLAQTRPVDEIIVVDDGSTDGTWETLQALSRDVQRPRIVLHRQENKGPSAARNAGVRLATGELIAFLDSDDTWLPEKTARQLELFAARPQLGLIGIPIQDAGVFRGRRLVEIGIERLLFRNYFPTPGVMLRREVLAAVGGFAEDMRLCEDYELWLRIAARHPCLLLNEELIHCGGGKHPFGESGLSANLWANQRAELEAFRRWRRAGGSLGRYVYALAICWLRFLRRVLIVAGRAPSSRAS